MIKINIQTILLILLFLTIIHAHAISTSAKGSLLEGFASAILDDDDKDTSRILMFRSNEFKPECCPYTYSSSSGCACANPSQIDFLQKRGNNNVPFI